MKKVKVSDKGQVALPVSVLRRAGIRVGDHLLISQSGSRIVLTKGAPQRELARDEFWTMMEAIWERPGGTGLEATLLRHRRRDVRKEAGRV